MHKNIYVWNPVIKELRKIPLTNFDCGGSCGDGFGFGYSSVVNDYKIVRFYNKCGVQWTEVNMIMME